MPAEIEAVGDVGEIAQDFRLLGIAQAPRPLLRQFLRERVAVVVALAVAARAGIAVPIPDAADVLALLEADDLEAEAAQLVDGIEPCEARTDDDGIAVRLDTCIGRRRHT